MNVSDVQRLLAAAGYYKGAIEGGEETKTLAAINKLLTARATECTSDPSKWSATRRRVGAGQLVLKHAGFYSGAIDGYDGNLTTGALIEWNTFVTTGKKLVLDRKPIAPAIKTRFPSQRECPDFYGKPGLPGTKAERAMAARMVKVELPFPFRIDYNLRQTVRTISLHEKCADSGGNALAEIAGTYGEAEMRRLGLDRFAGSYNPRYMRGGKSFSMHAYGCATDWQAAPNGLTARCPKALFCKPEYQTFFDIWEKHGWTSLGRAIGRDFMHVQAATL